MTQTFQSPEKVVYRRLISSASVANLCGLRIYPMLAPSTAQIPFVVYSRSSIMREATLEGVSGVPRVRTDYTIYGRTYEECRVLADSIRQTLDGYTGTAYSVVVSRCTLDQESDGIATLEGGETPPAYQVTQTYEVLWQEI